MELGEAAVGHLVLDQVLGDDADHAAAGLERAVGHRAHHAHLPAAEHHLPPTGGDGPAQLTRGGRVAGEAAGGGAAEHADAAQSHDIPLPNGRPRPALHPEGDLTGGDRN